MNTPDKDVYRAMSGRVLSAGAFVPVELGCTSLPVYGCVPQPGSSLNPILFGFLWRLYHMR